MANVLRNALPPREYLGQSYSRDANRGKRLTRRRGREGRGRIEIIASREWRRIEQSYLGR